MSYRLKIDPRSRKVARAISRLQLKFQKALAASGLSQQEVAHKLSVDRSVINRRFKDNANLTVRSMVELADVLGRELEINLPERSKKTGQNWVVTTTTPTMQVAEVPKLTKAAQASHRTTTVELAG